MIVVSERRAGGTKFCLDLAKEKGLTFVAETSDRSVEELKYIRLYNDNMNGKPPKAIYHETNSADFYDFEELINKIDNHEQYVFLHNEFRTPMSFKDADIFLMRESLRDGCISVLNFHLRIFSSIAEFPFEYILDQAAQITRDQIAQSYMMKRYCLLRDIEPIFYERQEWAKPVNSSHIDMLYYSHKLYKIIDDIIKQTDIDFYNQMLLTKYKK